MGVNRLSTPKAITLLVLFVLCSSVVAFPGQRRPHNTFVGKLVNASPFRSLSNYISRKLSEKGYYPPAPNQQALQQPQAPVYSPAVPAIGVPSQVQPPNYILQGTVSYSVPVLTQQQPVASNYYYPSSATVIPQSNSPVNGYGNSQESTASNGHFNSIQYAYYPNTPTATHVPSQNAHVSLPSPLLSTANAINEQLPNSGFLSLPNLPKLSANVQMQIDGFEDASSSASEDMLKIYVIRPRDLQKMKSSSEEERKKFVKGYETKYIDVEQRVQQLMLNSDTRNAAIFPKKEDSGCIEPLCDPFLRKLIPELMSSTGRSEDPIVIVKNDSDTSKVKENFDSLRLNDMPQNQGEEPEFTVVKAIEEEDGNSVEILQGQDSTLKPNRIRVHFPRRKFISAKLNHTSNFKKYEPLTSKNRQHKLSIKFPRLHKFRSPLNQTDKFSNHVVGNASSTTLPSTSSPLDVSSTLAPEPSFTEETASKKSILKGQQQSRMQRKFRGSIRLPTQNKEQKDSASSSRSNFGYRTAHYTAAGVLFNNPKK